MKRIIKNAKVLYQGQLQKLDVLFDEKEILEISEQIDTDAEVIDAAGACLLPGLVDVHVHFRQPGREDKETIYTGSLAAAHGGFTTVFAMPNVIPSPDTKEVVQAYLDLIQKESVIHTYPYGTITVEEKGNALSDLNGMYDLGIRQFSDDGVGMNDQSLMEKALLFSKEKNCIIACHTEDMSYRKTGASVHEAQYAHDNGWIGIPDECESSPLTQDLITAVKTKGKYHACHISSHLSVEALAKAQREGGDVTAEVTAHHLLLNNEDVHDTNAKMNPPLRTEADRQCLIQALEDGTLSFIASDHAPHTEEDKAKSMSQAAFGIVSLETSFPLLYTEFVVKEKRWTLQQLVEWMSEKPAKRFSLDKTGKIEKGYVSDMILIDLEHAYTINPEKFFSKGKNTPFAGRKVYGKILETIVDGKTVYKE